MIVVTGPGRSGTSLVARLYQELGFDPGGRWHPSINAGFEAQEVREVNERIAAELGLAWLGPREPSERAKRVARSVVPARFRRAVRKAAYSMPWVRGRGPGLMRWDRLDDVVARYGPALRELSGSLPVVKDPRFSWTLKAWAAAGAKIEHVLVCVRALDAMLRSRLEAGHVPESWIRAGRDGFVYGLGLCMMTIHDHRLEHSVIRFPDFLRAPDDLYSAMRFPAPVSRERFLEAFRRVADPELVHHWQ